MCFRIATMAVSLALLSVVSPALCWGQNAPGQSSDSTVVKLKPMNVEAASAVNFNRAFGLPFESLNSLGQRIDHARRASDPVALASAARELGVAEAVSGKKASLRSADVMKEA